MNLTPSLERESGQVILEGVSAGAAGEAPLTPVPGLDLAFDRVDGRLLRAVVDAIGADGSVQVGEQAAAMLTRLFDAEAPSMVSNTAAKPSGASGGACSLVPEPELAGMLSSLARLDAARATSPVPPGSPWWGAEAAELAERAGLHTRARAEAHQALPGLLGRLQGPATLPEDAVRAAQAVAGIAAAGKPEAAGRLTEAIGKRPGPRLVAPPTAAPPMVLAFDVAAEVKNLEKDLVRLAGPQWMLDPWLVPEGLFRPALSPYSDLYVRHEDAEDRLMVVALLAPGADCRALARCQARLVDPGVRRVLTVASFSKVESSVTSDPAPSRVRAELKLPVPLEELAGTWIEVVQDKHQPVLSAKGHYIRCALRWADAALRAERAPAGLDRRSTRADWIDLAATAWEHCRRDWAAAGDAYRAELAAQRKAAIDPRTRGPEPPAGGPAYLAEVLGC